jgi:hypothetical protein
LQKGLVHLTKREQYYVAIFAPTDDYCLFVTISDKEWNNQQIINLLKDACDDIDVELGKRFLKYAYEDINVE